MSDSLRKKLSAGQIEDAILGLNSGCYARRYNNAFLLGRHKISQAVKPLVERYDREYDDDVRGAIIDALGKIGGDEAVRKLKEIIVKNDEMSAIALRQLNKKKKLIEHLLSL